MTTRAKTSQRLQATRRAIQRGAPRVETSRRLVGPGRGRHESIGILPALLFLDWLYQPLPSVRIGMWVVALGGIVYLLARHVLKPLGRKISDEQIALYIEEHRTELDGVLITAAEFGKKREQSSDNQVALIDAVVHEAAARSARTRVGSVIDFSRLKKYGVGAVAGIGLYLVLSVLFPNTVGSHIGRILEPWLVTEQDKAKHAAVAAAEEPMRSRFPSKTRACRAARRSTLRQRFRNPKPAEEAVELYFRPKKSRRRLEKAGDDRDRKAERFPGRAARRKRGP